MLTYADEDRYIHTALVLVALLAVAVNVLDVC
jgi:hypothetical protein